MRALRRVELRSFGAGLLLVAVAAFAIRLVYIARARHLPIGYDTAWYTLVSGSIAHGRGFIDPQTAFTTGRAVPTASHAPLYPVFLAGVTRIVDDRLSSFRLAGALAGTVTVVLTGLIGRRIGGRAVGLVAAALAAVFPSLIAVDGALMSETIAIPLLLGAVLVALVAIEHPSWWLFAVLGGLLGLTVLARADAIFVAVCVVVPTALLAGGRRPRTLALATIALAGVAIVVMPWMLRNEARLGRFVVATTSTSRGVAGANCPAAYHGRLVGYWDAGCATDSVGRDSESGIYDEQLKRGLDYARAHLSRLLPVGVVRELRAFGFYAPRQQAKLESIETRSYHWQLLAWVAWLPALALGVAGFAAMLRRRVRGAWVLLGVIASVAIVAAVGYGNQRFRTACEPVVLVAAAYAVVAGQRTRRRARRTAQSEALAAVD